MISKEHKKHSFLTKPSYGNFGRNEWAFTGTICSTIKGLANTIIQTLSMDYKCAYIDAQHGGDDENALPGRLEAGATTEYIRHPHHHQFNYNKEYSRLQLRRFFTDTDLVLVNGNHHEAKAQVVIIDPVKESSLKKRLEQLTNVQLILLADGADEVFGFVKETQPLWEQLPVYRLSETDKIIQFFRTRLQQAKPKVNGLVLAGGKSVRMGRDKGLMKWHGKEQRYHMADILEDFCDEVFISCRPEQESEIAEGYKTLTDTFIDLGQYGAILSAFRTQPDRAWLIVACDLPLVDAGVIETLVQHRDTAATATAYESPGDGLPEPLIAVWEPKSYPVLLAFLSQGYSCPRKALLNSEPHLLKAENPDVLRNVNTPDEAEEVKRLLSGEQLTA